MGIYVDDTLTEELLSAWEERRLAHAELFATGYTPGKDDAGERERRVKKFAAADNRVMRVVERLIEHYNQDEVTKNSNDSKPVVGPQCRRCGAALFYGDENMADKPGYLPNTIQGRGLFKAHGTCLRCFTAGKR